MSSEKVGLGLVLIGVRPILASTDRRHRLGEIGSGQIETAKQEVEPGNGREATAIRVTEGPSILPKDLAIILPKLGRLRVGRRILGTG
jgi:hypothetical protein